MGSKQSEAEKHNQNPVERRIQDIKDTTRNIIDLSGAPIWSWLLYMAYAVSIINYMAHRPLFLLTPHESAYGSTPNVAHLMELEFWEPILT